MVGLRERERVAAKHAALRHRAGLASIAELSFGTRNPTKSVQEKHDLWSHTKGHDAVGLFHWLFISFQLAYTHKIKIE